ncbi:Flavin-dependent monooxygenase, oxygenase subunit HsaA [Delftia tsuruhatensis]|uniref:SfnB family sulfur acquisition oxidoreductase n=1 Tax=Delftia tsuruhatensis TaxID=180282 RepID=UPI001E6F89A9|nr:SfnB family sulfur acquisition oxidoreductase [Delftia tsuruhatensis]CAB5688250.1 Flavin-dependent monooxygenase, oxygenase subunit HsaA [Delftia tsuruhatensis]CAC9690875.1 Flavin-dependent monooxygenase, oxygenase subunit HsaA [Delftia tsuruhatensis]
MTQTSTQELRALACTPGGRPQPAPLPAQPAHIIRNEAEALEAARSFAALVAPGALQRDRDRLLPWREVEQFSHSGLWGITIPQEYGGAGVSTGTLTQAVGLIAAADGNLGHIPQNHYYALEVLRVGGSPAQKAFFYDRVLRGERLGNALAEIGHRDFRRRTQLLRESAGWFVQGSKFYCTGALFAHWIPTLASAQEDGGERMSLVFIPRDAPGVTVTDDWDGFGQRVTGSGSVQFERVRVEPEWVVPFTSSFERPTTIGPFAQIIHAALDAGIGHGALQAALPFIREHARPWVDSGVASAAQDPLLLQQLGNVHVRLRAADALVGRAALAVDAAQRAPTDDSVAAASVAVAQAKALSTSASLLAGSKLFELAGTASTLAGQGLDRFWRNARVHTLHDPVRWKYHAVGNYVLNGIRPPRHGAL